MSKQSLGVQNGKLTPCPSSPNCVSTQSDDSSKKMESLPFEEDLNKTKQKVKTILESYPRTEIQKEDDHYIHATFKTKLFRFTDDVEFYFDEEEQVVHFRSASRVGYSDLGKNRSRMEEIQKLYHK